MNALIIDPMKPREVDEVSRLIADSIRKGFVGVYPPEVIEALVRGNSPEAIQNHAPKQVDYVLHSDGRMLGMIGLKRNEIGHLFVHPEAYGKGLGRALVEFARQAFEEAGHTEMVVLASLNAVGFYTCCGFVEQAPGNFSVGNGLLLDYIRMTCAIGKE